MKSAAGQTGLAVGAFGGLALAAWATARAFAWPHADAGEWLAALLAAGCAATALFLSLRGWRDAKRQRLQADTAFRATMAILHGFFRSTPLRMGVVEVLADDVRHIWDNEAAARAFGMDPDAMEDQRLSALLGDDAALRAWLEAYRECRETDAPVRFEYHAREADGLHWFSATVFPINYGTGPINRCAYVCQDMTDLIESRRKAEEASRAKSLFLATMSHELRTPLNAVIGFSNLMLSRPEVPLEERRLYLERVNDNGKRLLSLISDILDLTKAESGTMRTADETVDLRPLLEEMTLYGDTLGREKGLSLALSLPPEAPHLRTDGQKLRRILLALLENAFKFTESGQVALELVRSREGFWAIEVRDRGPGVPEREREMIFQPFQQGSAGLNGRRGGSGLGLAIARTLSQELGFRLEVDENPGGGSVFRVRLSREVDWSPARPDVPRPASPEPAGLSEGAPP